MFLSSTSKWKQNRILAHVFNRVTQVLGKMMYYFSYIFVVVKYLFSWLNHSCCCFSQKRKKKKNSCWSTMSCVCVSIYTHIYIYIKLCELFCQLGVYFYITCYKKNCNHKLIKPEYDNIFFTLCAFYSLCDFNLWCMLYNFHYLWLTEL